MGTAATIMCLYSSCNCMDFIEVQTRSCLSEIWSVVGDLFSWLQLCCCIRRGRMLSQPREWIAFKELVSSLISDRHLVWPKEAVQCWVSRQLACTYLNRCSAGACLENGKVWICPVFQALSASTQVMWSLPCDWRGVCDLSVFGVCTAPIAARQPVPLIFAV